MREAQEDIAKRGVMIRARSKADQARGSAGLVKNPSVSVLRGALADLRQLGAQLGLTPMSRDRVDRGLDEGDSDDLNELLGLTGGDLD